MPDWDTESTYSLLLNPADWEEDDPWDAMDDGNSDDDGDDDPIKRKCPGCDKRYKGETEKGREKWIASHIRLHNIADRRKKLLKKDELLANLGKEMAATLIELRSMENWESTKEIASLLLNIDTSQLRKFLGEKLVPIIDKTSTGFLHDDHHANNKEVHKLLCSQSFRTKAIKLLEECVGNKTGLNMFLSSFIMRLKNNLILLRISKMKERLPTPAKVTYDLARKEVVFYIVGYILKKVKDKCWRNGNIKRDKYARRYHTIKHYFMENGDHAEPMEEAEVRQWVDAKNRGDPEKGNGLVVPSKAAFSFFIRLDSIARTFEGVQDLTGPLTMEAIYSKCMDDLELLDLWQKITNDLGDVEQHLFLDSTINLYRRFVGHAASKRIERCFPRKATVATRTNLKKNPTGGKKKQRKQGNTKKN